MIEKEVVSGGWFHEDERGARIGTRGEKVNGCVIANHCIALMLLLTTNRDT